MNKTAKSVNPVPKLCKSIKALQWGLLLLFIVVLSLPGFAQRKARVDTVAAYKALMDGRNRLQEAGKFDSAITLYYQAMEGYISGNGGLQSLCFEFAKQEEMDSTKEKSLGKAF